MNPQCLEYDRHDPSDGDLRQFFCVLQPANASCRLFCARSANTVFNVALQIMRTKEDAEDVVQESFTLAFIHFTTFNWTSRFHYIRRELLQAYLSPFDVEDQNFESRTALFSKGTSWDASQSCK